MRYDLKGKNVLVTGGSRGLGEVLCKTFAAEGCNIAINYFNRVEAADEVKAFVEKECGVKAVVVKGDATSTADARRVVAESNELLGGLDIVISNAGWTRFSDFNDIEALSEEEWDRCWNANVKVPLALAQASRETFLANLDGGVILITSSIAATSQSGSSMAYSVTKTAQVQLMKCLAKTQGPKIRVNAVLPGLLLTEWGLRYSDDVLKWAKDTAVLKHETFLQDCADTFVMLAKNTSMTGVPVTVDAGLNIQGS